MKNKGAIYARVSSQGDRQNTERQILDLESYAQAKGIEVVRVYTEKASGAKDDRPVLAECVQYILDGNADTLLVTEVSRLGRTVKIIVDTMDLLTKAGKNVHILDLGIDTLTSTGEENQIAKLLMTVLAMGAEIERKSIIGRLNSGREVAKAKGVHFGRKAGAIIKTREDKEREYHKVLKELKSGVSIAKTAKLCDVSISTVKRLKKEFCL